jgi:hypothetical protein
VRMPDRVVAATLLDLARGLLDVVQPQPTHATAFSDKVAAVPGVEP